MRYTAIDPGDGKRGTAPCGHAGVHVFGSFVQCLFGCDKRATERDERARPRVTEQLAPQYTCSHAVIHTDPVGFRRCTRCGKVNP